ncbi:MAG: 30S ribosomal protein S20 [Betaproteobacteria bacterium]|nr:30S ribosomal protein S20 [Betaproteobacteria bacterium]
MANSASARKRARQADARRAHNMSLRTAARTAIKNVEKAILAGDRAAAEAVLVRCSSTIDRVAAKGVLHRNAANRHKSRLALTIKAMAQ